MPGNIAFVDLGDVAVTVEVTNRATTAATPTCTVRAADATGGHHGAGTFTLRQPLEPAQTTSFTAKVRISGQAADQVTTASVTCN